MKRLIILGVVMLTMLSVSAQGKFKISGRTVDQTGDAIAYSTVVLLDGNNNQVVGTSTTAEGHFALSAARGNYTLLVTFIGFENNSQTIALTSNLDLGNITLSQSSQAIDAVVITEHAVRREADRFIVAIANNPVASGKDAYEMLRTAPGVWASSNTGITINGQSGTRVMIDDRFLDLSGEDLEAYLHSLAATDIQRIEVIPSSGAEYDANSSGGIIKIVLVKKRTSGIEGNIGLRGNWSPLTNDYRIAPNGRINYFQDKLNLYTQMGYNHSKSTNEGEERTEYTTGSNLLSNTEMNDNSDRYNITIGSVYDLTSKSSIGLELSYYGSGQDGSTDAFSKLNSDVTNYIQDTSKYNTTEKSGYYGTSLNYILKLDDKGSTFKVLGDWNGNIGDNNNLYNTITHTFSPAEIITDSTYRNISSSRYNVYSLGADVELINSASRSIKFGAKYTRNQMYSEQLYEGLDGMNWLEPNENANQPTDYNENIAAIYGIYNQKFGNISASFGLRGEYTDYNPTYTDPETGDPVTSNKWYIDIFPTLTINIPFNQTQSHILIGNFARRISRPGFWALNPFRRQLSEYSYIVGNPNLSPTYSNNATLTYVYKYRYTLTAGLQMQENQVQQKIMTDPNNSDILMYQFANIPLTSQYFLALNAPFVLNDWWSINFNAFGMMQEQKLEIWGQKKYNPMTQVYISNAFILPKKWEIELSFWGMTKIMQSNMMVEPMYDLTLNITKRVGKWTFGASVSNILQREMKINISDPAFEKQTIMRGMNGGWMTLGLSVRYNFNAGVKFRARTVESGIDEDRSGGGGGGATGGVSAPTGN